MLGKELRGRTDIFCLVGIFVKKSQTCPFYHIPPACVCYYPITEAHLHSAGKNANTADEWQITFR